MPLQEAQSAALLTALFSALEPGSSIAVENAGAATSAADEIDALAKKVKAELLIAGFGELSIKGSGAQQRIQGRKPAAAQANGAAASAALPLRRKLNGGARLLALEVVHRHRENVSARLCCRAETALSKEVDLKAASHTYKKESGSGPLGGRWPAILQQCSPPPQG